MNGIKINGVTLFMGKIPYRKQTCLYFVEGSISYPVAYIREDMLSDAQCLWSKMLSGISEELKP